MTIPFLLPITFSHWNSVPPLRLSDSMKPTSHSGSLVWHRNYIRRTGDSVCISVLYMYILIFFFVIYERSWRRRMINPKDYQRRFCPEVGLFFSDLDWIGLD